MLAAGTVLGPYRIVGPIGAGGMGVVYRAEDTRLDRSVAIKFLSEDSSTGRQAERLQREARAASALDHPGICTIHDVGEHEGRPFIVMELLSGQTLKELLASRSLGQEEVVDWGAQIADALEAAHARGIVHRDLKPANIFVTERGQVKILDFGLAKLSLMGRPADTITDSGTIVGTMAYMSPEQARGEEVDARTDVFSLGVVLYEMATMALPFQGSTAAILFDGILNRTPLPPAQLNPQVTPGLERIIGKALEKVVAARYRSAGELLRELRMLGRAPRARRPRARAIDSLAVLPFVNVGADPNCEYLSDGVTEFLINSLSSLPKMRVVPRSLAFRYRGREADLETVGRELNVRAVLTGRVVERHERLNIQAELVDVAEVSQLWGKQYDRRFSDLIAVQEEIARDVAAKLRPRRAGEQQRRLSKRYTEDVEAHQLYLKGRYWWSRRTAQTVRRAAEYFQQAINKDPGFALAWAGLADCYLLYSFYGIVSTNDCMPKAEAAAMRALAIDDTVAEAHASLAYARRHRDWDWQGALRGFQRALEIKPDYATARQWHGTTLWALGRLEEGIEELTRAQESDPLSAVISAEIGRGLYFARQYGPAIGELRKLLDEIDPHFGVAHWHLGMIYEQQGRLEDAVRELEQWRALSDGNPAALGALGHAYAVSGKTAEAQKLLAELIEQARIRYVAPYDLAVLSIGLGDRNQALEWLDRAYEDHSAWLIWVDLDPRFQALHGEPRYLDLLRRMGLSPPASRMLPPESPS